MKLNDIINLIEVEHRKVKDDEHSCSIRRFVDKLVRMFERNFDRNKVLDKIINFCEASSATDSKHAPEFTEIIKYIQELKEK